MERTFCKYPYFMIKIQCTFTGKPSFLDSEKSLLRKVWTVAKSGRCWRAATQCMMQNVALSLAQPARQRLQRLLAACSCYDTCDKWQQWCDRKAGTRRHLQSEKQHTRQISLDRLAEGGASINADRGVNCIRPQLHPLHLDVAKAARITIFSCSICKDLGEGLGWINKILQSLKWSCWRTNSGQFKIPKQKNKPIRAVLIRIPNRKQKQSSLSGMFCRTSFIPNQFRAVRIASYSYLVTISISFYFIGVSIRQQNEFFEENMVSSVTCHFRQVFILPRRCCNLERNIRIFGRARKISWKNYHFREILFRKGRRPGRGG